ncbi:MAG: protoporphyrinogen oxidase [Gemmatimonadota bacterium]
MPMGGNESSVAVIGGGIAGLAAAWEVTNAGGSAIVLESEARVGGVITSERRGDYLVEMGPASAIMTPELSRLISSLGSRIRRVDPLPSARRRYVVRGARLIAVPTTPPAMLASPLLSVVGKARALADLVLPRAHATDEEESLAALARRRFGKEVAEYLIDPMVSGIYAGDPERLSSRHTLRALYDLEQRHGSVIRGAIRMSRARRQAKAADPDGAHRSMFSFRGGLRELPDAIAASLGSAVRLRTRVRALAPEGTHWRLDCEGVDGVVRRIRVSSVIATIPAHALAAMEMPAALRLAIAPVERVANVAVATVALGFRRSEIAHPLDGFGALVPHAEHSGILGVLFSSSIFQSRAPAGSALVTCMIGGARNASAAHEGEQALVRRALDAIGPLLGISAQPSFVRAKRWPNAIPQYELRHDLVVEAVSSAEQRFSGLYLSGSYCDGVSIGDRVASGIRAGARAAALGTIGLEQRRLG